MFLSSVFRFYQLFVVSAVVLVLFVGFVWAAENHALLRRFRRNHPSFCLLAILLACYIVLSLLGSVSLFLFGIVLPILRKMTDTHTHTHTHTHTLSKCICDITSSIVCPWLVSITNSIPLKSPRANSPLIDDLFIQNLIVYIFSESTSSHSYNIVALHCY